MTLLCQCLIADARRFAVGERAARAETSAWMDRRGQVKWEEVARSEIAVDPVAGRCGQGLAGQGPVCHAQLQQSGRPARWWS
jgi:hypothetical protein